jgi:acetyltransferase-like isoleucine patch superfamily enzyme
MKRIKLHISEKLFRLSLYMYKRVVTESQQLAVEGLRKTPQAAIDKSFSMGEYTCFTIEPEAKAINIEYGVSCRRFCNFLVRSGASLTIHKDVFFNNYCSINCLFSIEIGENTIFGEGVKLYDHNHRYEYTADRQLKVGRDDYSTGAITIGRNCWIGSNVTILKNVEIGDNVIIGANNLIYQSILANSIVKAKTDQIIEGE